MFVKGPHGTPVIIGTVSAYMPNRITGDTLPGLLRAQGVTAFQETVRTIKSVDEARKKAEEEERRRQQEEQQRQERRRIPRVGPARSS